MTPLETLRAVASDPAATPGAVFDALAPCTTLPDFPFGLFSLRLQMGGWSTDIRAAALRACNEYAALHANGEAARAESARSAREYVRLSAFWKARGVDPRDVDAACQLVRLSTGYGDTFATASSGGLDCRIYKNVNHRYEPATLAEAAHNTKPFGYADVTVGNLRRLAALSIVEHRDKRLCFAADIVAALREEGFVDADGKAVRP